MTNEFSTKILLLLIVMFVNTLNDHHDYDVRFTIERKSLIKFSINATVDVYNVIRNKIPMLR